MKIRQNHRPFLCFNKEAECSYSIPVLRYCNIASCCPVGLPTLERASAASIRNEEDKIAPLLNVTKQSNQVKFTAKERVIVLDFEAFLGLIRWVSLLTLPQTIKTLVSKQDEAASALKSKHSVVSPNHEDRTDEKIDRERERERNVSVKVQNP
ncbi:hypothetical protein H6P81_018169 [Aristolochia fimbriata]|uniref:Uncharacterized protein n=1 Tax=Aristolochia fimbriata TaxID=158543 RepID=A0AAV7E2B6_ARIFI|nr:hypothetical protein H6P81_018169 [Aristolochia fimbriata]